MVTRPVVKKPSVVVSRIIDIDKKPMSEPHMGERERLIKEVRFLLENAVVSLSHAGDFDLKEFLERISMAKMSRNDESIILISGGKFYKFYVDDIGPGNMPVSVNKDNRIRLEDGEQTYYLFPVGRS